MNLRPLLRLRLSLSVVAFLAAGSTLAETNRDQREARVDWATRIQALGGAAPGQTPVKFSENSISRPDRYEYGTTFSPDGTHFFFGVDLGHRAEIRVSRWNEGRWSGDDTFLASEEASYNDPMMSANGERLYFITDQESRDGSFDIAYVEQTKAGWSEIRLAADLSTSSNEYFWSESTTGEQFFARDTATAGNGPDFDIFSKKREKRAAESVLSAAVNSPYYEGDPFVLLEGDTLVFVSNRPGGAGRGDLYVSHRAASGDWGSANSLGIPINTSGHEITPYVTPDGRWLLFSRGGDIYWTSAGLLERISR